jgi:hypothetical protein
MSAKDDYVKKNYFCSICNQHHDIIFKKEILKGRTKFPFSYIFLHGDLYDILTTLYLDANLNIRGTEMVKLDDSENIFDKEQMTDIVKNLTMELATLQQEYNDLLNKYNQLKDKYERK